MAASHTKARTQKAHLPPGTLIYTGRHRSSKQKITVFDYDSDAFEELTLETIGQCQKYKSSGNVTWINIDGLANVESIEKIGTDFGMHTLVLEDILNTAQRPKFEDYGEYIFIVVKMLGLDADEAIMHRIHSMKRRMISLRRSIWPLREVVSAMERSESPIVAKRTRIYIRDLYDHTIQVIDTVESLRDIASGMLDTYLSAISNRMNSVMKVLTIIATIFIPLTFIAGVYGMNFEYMPELDYPWAYPAVLLIMLAVSLGMLVFFKRKKWI